MKKYFNFAFLSAIALIGTFGLTACSSSDDLAAETNPNYNPETREVTTQFVFNVSNGNTGSTRMTEDATQASSALAANKFRGITDSYLMCFKQTSGDGNYLAAAATADKSFNMSRVAAAGTLSNEQSRRVLEMSLPLNVNTMLFYGRAITETDDQTSRNSFGHLDEYKIADDLTTINFKLGKRLQNTEKTQFKEIQKLLAAAMSCIMNTNRGEAAVAATDAPGEGIKPYGFALPATYKPNMTWSEYNASVSPADGGALGPLELKLKNVYKEMTTVQTAELRNASGFALKETIKNLWSVINSVRCAEPTNQEEALAKYMANLIDQELRKYFTPTTVPTNGGSVEGISIKGASDLINALSADTFWPTTTAGTKPANSEFSHINTLSSTDMGRFPEQFDLPQGSTHTKFDNTKKTFYYVENYNSSAVGGGEFTVDDYYYPAELLYFGNSALRVSDKEHVVADYPASVTLWNTDATTSWPTDWSIGHVQSSTRSVAMKNDINYGTSLLKTTIGYNVTTLQDNNKYIQKRDFDVDEDNKSIPVTDTSFKLVGVLVGDQWPNVGWNFLPNTAVGRKGYVYDKQITNNGVIPASSASDPNYTLVFDNYVEEASQPKVYVALELQNNTGQDFFGKDNLITNGSNFYLVGELNPDGKDAPALPAYHALPPYKSTLTDKTVARVFIQDHMTTANFKIGEYSLQYAYLTVPDLRSSSVTLGLSVDLQWSTGLSFDNIIVGGNTQTTVP